MADVPPRQPREQLAGRHLLKPVHCALLPVAFLGCSASGTLGPGQVARLDGYNAYDRKQSDRELEMVNGRRLVFTPDTRLTLDMPGLRIVERFDWIRVQDNLFEGRTSDGRQIQIPLGDISSAEMEGGQPGAAAAIVIGLLVGLLGFYAAWQTVVRPSDDPGP